MTAEWPLLQTGSQGASVQALQRLLVHRGATLDVDAIFGPETEGAVKAHQTASGVASDGRVGNETWPVTIVQVGNGSTGEAVTAAQELLAFTSDGLAADGIFGPETDKATRAFQEGAGLAVDGIVGPETWHALIASSPGS